MKKLSNTIMVDKDDSVDTNTVMNSIFSCDEEDELFNNVYKTIEWEMSEWFIKKGVTQKKEDIYIYVETLPDYFKSYTVENDKFLRICIKHKIKVDDIGYKKIKSRFIIKNIKSKYRSIIKGLDLIKIINYMEINDIPNTKLINVNLNTEINLTIPYKNDFENYLVGIFETINENFRTKLTR
jgi:uncharacterized lipoprotein YehR (DUF1307 family)